MVCSFSSHNGFPGDESPETIFYTDFDTQNKEKLYPTLFAPRQSQKHSRSLLAILLIDRLFPSQILNLGTL